MVGRTPEFLGKKIEAREIKLTSLGVLRHAAGGAPGHRLRDGDQVRASPRSSPQGRRASASRSTPTCRRPTTTARPSPATRASTSHAGQHRRPRHHLRRPARRRDDARARFPPISSCSPSPARWPASACPAGLGTLRTDTPTFVALLGGRRADRRPDLLPRPPARPRRAGHDRPPLLMRRTENTPPSPPGLHRRARPGLSAGHDRRLAGRRSRARPTARVSSSRRQGRRLGARSARTSTRRARPTSSRRRRSTDYSPAGDVLLQPRAEPAGARRSSSATTSTPTWRSSALSPRPEPREVPADAVTTSASGVDPHISEANAGIQAHRVAAVRRLPLDRVNSSSPTTPTGRFLGLGEPGVNVLELNLALDKEAAADDRPSYRSLFSARSSVAGDRRVVRASSTRACSSATRSCSWSRSARC